MPRSKIFISIASYKDKLLSATINDLFSNSSGANELVVWVLDQNEEGKHLEDDRVNVLKYHFTESKGACWARAILQSKIQDEDYFLQIDAHMQFAPDWDSKMIQELSLCNWPKPILSFYPNGFDEERGKYERSKSINVIKGFNYAGSVCSKAIGLGEGPTAIYNGANRPVLGQTFAAGFSFSKIDFPREVPYDSNLFWENEEGDITLRAFSFGYRFFGTSEPLIWHKYNVISGSPNHFTENKEGHALARKDHKIGKEKRDAWKEGFGTFSRKAYEAIYGVDISSQQLKELKKDILVVVPERDRGRDLEKYLELMPKFLDKQGFTYDILICQLSEGGDWNLGLTANTLVNFHHRATYKYVYISHVDVYPVGGTFRLPKDNEVIHKLGDIGSFITTYESFFKVNGFSNDFFGWGSEDDDFYSKSAKSGLILTENKDITFNDEYQNHHRQYLAVNYRYNLRELHRDTPIYKYGGVKEVFQYSEITEFEVIADNIFKQTVKPKIKSPRNSHNGKVVLAYMNNTRVLDPWFESFLVQTSEYADRDFDIVVVLTENSHKTYFDKLKGYGINYVSVPARDLKNSCIDRYREYKKILQGGAYTQVIFSDFDIKLNNNPFDNFKSLFVGSEGVIIADEPWNAKFKDYIKDFPMDKEVLCAGFWGGEVSKVLSVLDELESEVSENRGVTNIWGSDQPLLNKILHNRDDVYIYREHDGFTIHLTSYRNHKGTTKYGFNSVSKQGKNHINSLGNRFVVEHQPMITDK